MGGPVDPKKLARAIETELEHTLTRLTPVCHRGCNRLHHHPIV
jgi:hypothetical protein